MADENQDEHAQAAASHDEAAHAADQGSTHPASAGHGDAAHAAHNPFDKDHLIGHVKDAEYFELPRMLGGKLMIPQPFKTEEPILQPAVGFAPIDDRIEPFDLKLTKFMVLEAIVALVLIVLFSVAAMRIKRGGAPRGRLANLLESMVVFIRDEVARPAIGRHDADRFLPYLLTVFVFVVGCNLFGLLPWGGSATGALATTGAMALTTFGVVVFSGMAKLGPIRFWLAQVPHMDLPGPIVGVAQANDLRDRNHWVCASSISSWPCVFWPT